LPLSLGLSERVIGLTIVSIGTSLPELGAGLARRRQAAA
jgi:Ca2+/Na+ antiporter